MAKITMRIVTEMHEWDKVLVERPYGNETLVKPADGETEDSIVASIRQAIERVAPYARNCHTHNWAGRAATYVTVQPIRDPLRESVGKRIGAQSPCGTFVMRDNDFDGRLQLVVCTACPGDPIRPARRTWEDFDVFAN
jgi:hypothetical protein